jgi:hypothetical protein
MALSLAAPGPAASQDDLRIVVDADGASDAVDPAAARSVGEQFSVAVLVEGFAGDRGLGSASFELAYDPAILRAVLVRPSSVLKDAEFECPVLSATLPGDAQFECFLQPLPGDGPDGDLIPLAVVQFEATGPGTTALALRRAKLGQGTRLCIINVDNCELPAELFSPATVTVAAGSPSPSTTPGASPVVVDGDVDVLFSLDAVNGIKKGDTFSIVASAKNIPSPPGLGLFLIDLRFNKEVLSVVSKTQGKDGVQGMSCVNLDQDLPGLAQLACTFLPLPEQGPGGDLTLATITFKAKGRGDAQLRAPVVSLMGQAGAAGGGRFDPICFFSTDLTGLGCDKAVADVVSVPSVKITGSDTRWLLVGVVVVAALVVGGGGLTLAARRRRATKGTGA